MELSKFKKYKHLGRVYPETTEYWHKPILEMLEQLDEKCTPKWIPRFVLNIVVNLALTDSGRLKSRFFYKIFKSFGIKCEIQQIKSKFAELRVYSNITEELEYIVEEAEIACNLTCEHCGSMEQTKQVVVNRWVTNLCKTCRKKKNDAN